MKKKYLHIYYLNKIIVKNCIIQMFTFKYRKISLISIQSQKANGTYILGLFSTFILSRLTFFVDKGVRQFAPAIGSLQLWRTEDKPCF